VLDQPIETLSKGFKRRVGLAQALLHDPDVLILDEPTDGLDPNQKHEVRRLISSMPEKAIVISTHILEEVDAVCTRAIVIAQGRVLADGTPGVLAARSRHHNAVRLALALDGRDAATALLRLPSVEAVEPIEDIDGSALMIFPREGQSIIAEVTDLIRTAGWPVAALRVERGRLDDVFRAITLPGA
jgi:ABC-2 type transport system ATP-binding protein